MKKTQIPTFQKSFLHPKYWLLWCGIALWWVIVQLPYPVLVKIGSLLGILFSRVSIGKKRTAVAKRNLELCFPEKSADEIDQLLKANLNSVGMAVIETGMAWFWSDKRLKKWCKIEGVEYLKQYSSKGILLVGVHFLTLELGARIVGLYHSGIGVYRPNSNPVFDWLQTWGRLRSNKSMINRNDIRGMVKALRSGETVWYAPDHDYGRQSSVFVPFFAVPDAATTTGTHFLLKSAPNSVVIPFSPLRNIDNSGYIIKISAPVNFNDLDNATDIAKRMNQTIEKEIEQGIDQYMWLHRRFKTRPKESDPSLY